MCRPQTPTSVFRQAARQRSSDVRRKEAPEQLPVCQRQFGDSETQDEDETEAQRDKGVLETSLGSSSAGDGVGPEQKGLLNEPA